MAITTNTSRSTVCNSRGKFNFPLYSETCSQPNLSHTYLFRTMGTCPSLGFLLILLMHSLSFAGLSAGCRWLREKEPHRSW